MKRIAKIAIIMGVALMVFGLIVPWYVWQVELVRQNVATPLMDGGTQVSWWNLVAPRSMVHDVPSSKSQYVVTIGAAEELLKEIGVNWSIVPVLVPLAVVIVIVLAIVSQFKGQSRLRDGIGLVLTGGILASVLLIWNPASPPPFERLAPQPFLGKYVTVLGALLVTVSGLLNVFMKRQEKLPVTDQAPASTVPQYRTCLKCLESVPKGMEVCPHCEQKLT